MKLSFGYILRFFVLSVLVFVAYKAIAPFYTDALIVPLSALFEPLYALPQGSSVQFEWRQGAQAFHFAEVHIDVLCGNLVVVAALLLALKVPVRQRLRSLAVAMGLLFLFNELHLGVILMYSYHQAVPPGPSTLDAILRGIVMIAYHMGQQIGMMVVPFFLFLLLTLRQRAVPSASAQPSPPPAADLRSPR